MRDPYVYPHTDVLKNLANIEDAEMLSCMEAEYTSIRLAELVVKESASCFDFQALCEMHYYIFQDLYEWAGRIRIINIEKAEPALGGISIEYSDCFDIERDVTDVLKQMNQYRWEEDDLSGVSKAFSEYIAKLWRIHSFREGNTRTVVTFCCQFIESRGIYIASDLFEDHAQYMRTALVAASAEFKDLGDRRKMEYLEKIVFDALQLGNEMKERVSEIIRESGNDVTEDTIQTIIYWNRLEQREHNVKEIKEHLKR